MSESEVDSDSFEDYLFSSLITITLSFSDMNTYGN